MLIPHPVTYLQPAAAGESRVVLSAEKTVELSDGDELSFAGRRAGRRLSCRFRFECRPSAPPAGSTDAAAQAHRTQLAAEAPSESRPPAASPGPAHSNQPPNHVLSPGNRPDRTAAGAGAGAVERVGAGGKPGDPEPWAWFEGGGAFRSALDRKKARESPPISPNTQTTPAPHSSLVRLPY